MRERGLLICVLYAGDVCVLPCFRWYNRTYPVSNRGTVAYKTATEQGTPRQSRCSGRVPETACGSSKEDRDGEESLVIYRDSPAYRPLQTALTATARI